jgi:hypothetical protein
LRRYRPAQAVGVSGIDGGRDLLIEHDDDLVLDERIGDLRIRHDDRLGQHRGILLREYRRRQDERNQRASESTWLHR